ncbi:EHD1 [Lepeophtheirus salmonis]|uniref:EHD1 n=1 Tax=Lepeophtheirus salmonis TaxID=72036 RepID=A0A7R8CJS6_LEPSM|nr:EHD1 [Lepeophtheirus salmonis]CAF2795620.1 EHD1 [Lepeophtheirus salmonis]
MKKKRPLLLHHHQYAPLPFFVEVSSELMFNPTQITELTKCLQLELVDTRAAAPLFDQVQRHLEMFSWMNGDDTRKKHADIYENVTTGLQNVYRQKLLPLEKEYSFHDFHSPALEDPDFDARPMVMLVGQYSTGKTTFIRYLLEKDFPGIRIGPEPTTDRFIAVMHGDQDGVIPGNALVCSTTDSPVLKGISIVDTPGILSGEKQRTDRGYDFIGVLEWFAERVDRILLLFDAHKLDISDEFKRSIEALRGHDDKIRIVLNKADMVDHQQLMRVYGALMWSLGKVLGTPEVARVYIGSFWDEPLRYDMNRRLFEAEEQDLFSDLQSLPRNAALRKLNDLIKRARLAKVHAYIISGLRKDMPSIEYQISPGDFPDLQKMQKTLAHQDFTKFRPLDKKLLDRVDRMLAEDIAKLMTVIPLEEKNARAEGRDRIIGGAFDGVLDKVTPFMYKGGEGINAGILSMGKITGSAAKQEMVRSKLPNNVLGKIWKLSDVDRDGMLDVEEFALAMHLMNVKLDGHDLPIELPTHLIPPSKRGF